MPTAPKQVSKRNSAKIEEFELDDNTPILIVPGMRAVELTIEGALIGDKATLETAVLLPLEALKGTEVTISFPGTRYNGTWILVDFSYTEVNAKQFSYTLKLAKGSSHIIL